jgi:hypothetical protein
MKQADFLTPGISPSDGECEFTRKIARQKILQASMCISSAHVFSGKELDR